MLARGPSILTRTESHRDLRALSMEWGLEFPDREPPGETDEDERIREEEPKS